MELLKKILHYLSSIIYVLIIIYTIIWLPSLFGYTPLVILSGSMEPTYKVGSIIYYESVDKSKIGVGDIITFKGNKDELVSHRVVKVENDYYTTRGDANKVQDSSKVKYGSIVGKNLNINIKYIGYYIKFVLEHQYLIILAVLILILELLLSNNIMRREKKYEK